MYDNLPFNFVILRRCTSISTKSKIPEEKKRAMGASENQEICLLFDKSFHEGKSYDLYQLSSRSK